MWAERQGGLWTSSQLGDEDAGQRGSVAILPPMTPGHFGASSCLSVLNLEAGPGAFQGNDDF